MKRTLLKSCLLLVLAPLELLAGPAQQPDYTADVDELWRLVDDSYAYRDELGAGWEAAYETALEEAAACSDRGAFLAVVERALAHLADHHTHLGTNGPDSPALVPSGTDLWAVWKDEVPVVTAVRADSAAARAAVPVGAIVHSVDGVGVAPAIEALTGRPFADLDRRQRDWALRTVLAGRRGRPRELTLEAPAAGGEASLLSLGPAPAGGSPSGAPVDARRLEGDLGYVRIRDALGDGRCVAAFDAALGTLADTRGLVLDLRATPSGGNSTVARGILGRFVAREQPYQRHVLPGEERETGIARAWLELVAPRGPFRYEGSVVVLVGRWTASMGEGLAVGFDSLGAAVVGGRMAGLRGAIESFTLPESGFPVRIPVERLSHVDGTPRERFAGEPVHPLASPEEQLAAAVARLRRALDERAGATGR